MAFLNRKLACLAAAVAVPGVFSVSDYAAYDFEQYVAEFGKSYDSETAREERKRVFESNLKMVQAHNAEYQSGVHTWYMSMNHLADWTEAEFARLRSKKYSPSGHSIVRLTSSGANPDSVDWREHGAVTEVKNQGGCGSCWAFSATETLESHYFIATNKSVVLSPQTLVNCVKNPQHCGGTGGCQGATMELGFNLTAQTGIALESDLPYVGRDEECKPYKAAVKCSGYVKNPVNDPAGLETALATKGPVSVTVAANRWQMYGGGVFQGCSKPSLFHRQPDATLDHGVQAVGYTKDYWIVRNSWGPGWGEKGFIRVSRENDDKTFIDKDPSSGVACEPLPETETVGGECGILFDTSYPTDVSDASENLVVV